MPGLLPDVDPDGLLEFSVVYTDRALNHMSKKFVGVMQDILGMLKDVYHANTAVLIPGSGTFGMEAVARQFANRERVLIVRNGWFSYRWTQIFEMGQIPSEQIVLKARPLSAAPEAPWAPCPIQEVVATILKEKPAVVFAPANCPDPSRVLPRSHREPLAGEFTTYARRRRPARVGRCLCHCPSKRFGVSPCQFCLKLLLPTRSTSPAGSRRS